jgi:hypothetical protein
VRQAMIIIGVMALVFLGAMLMFRGQKLPR